MAILLKILLEEYDVEVYFVKSLQQTFFIITYLCQQILVETNHCLLVINWSQDKVEIVSESFTFGQS